MQKIFFTFLFCTCIIWFHLFSIFSFQNDWTWTIKASAWYTIIWFLKGKKNGWWKQLWYSNFFKNSASCVFDLYILTSHLQQHISYHVFQTPFPYLYFVCSAKKVRKSNITIPNLEIYNSILSLTSKWGILQERKKKRILFSSDMK